MTESLVDRPDRVFQLWAYTVGMRRLLLRSTKNEAFPTRVDVVFQNVKAVRLPTTLHGLVVTEADDDTADRIEAETGIRRGEKRFFTVVTSRAVGYLVAGVLVCHEDEGEYYEPSPIWPVLSAAASTD